jgi:hypothetical protein
LTYFNTENRELALLVWGLLMLAEYAIAPLEDSSLPK